MFIKANLEMMINNNLDQLNVHDKSAGCWIVTRKSVNDRVMEIIELDLEFKQLEVSKLYRVTYRDRDFYIQHDKDETAKRDIELQKLKIRQIKEMKIRQKEKEASTNT
jgi:hypothetical protein